MKTAMLMLEIKHFFQREKKAHLSNGYLERVPKAQKHHRN
jgi:hypothetical protein